MYGNYCGPYWSAGTFQESVCSDVPSVNDLDEVCRTHDCEIARAKNARELRTADRKFIKDGMKHGFVGGMMSKLVSMAGPGAQHLRHAGPSEDDSSNPGLIKMNKKKGKKNANRSGSTALVQAAAKPTKSKPAMAKTMVVSRAPVSIGTTIMGYRPRTQTTQNGVLISGRDFVSNVTASATSTWQLAAAIPLNPAFFVGTVLGNMSRTYQKFNIRKLVAHYVTLLPTSTTGEILLTATDNVSAVNADGSASTFLPRTMTANGSVMGPLWINHSYELDVKKRQWCLVDALQDVDINDNIYGELQVWVSCAGVAKSGSLGYVVLDYVMEFSDTMFQQHASLIPYACGCGIYLGLFNSAAPAANNAVMFNQDVPMVAAGQGSIFKFTVNLAASTFCTGLTAANSYKAATSYSSNTTTNSLQLFNITITNGQVLYLVKVGSTAVVYTSLTSAIAGEASGQLFYQTSSSASDNSGVFFGMIYQVQYGSADVSVPS